MVFDFSHKSLQCFFVIRCNWMFKKRNSGLIECFQKMIRCFLDRDESTLHEFVERIFIHTREMKGSES